PVWLGLGLRRVAARPLGRLSPPVCAAGEAAARTARRDVGCRVDHGDPRCTRRQSVPWRGASQGLGAIALCRDPHVDATGAPADATEQLAAPTRVGSPRGPRNHDGTIIPDTVDAMWGTDLTTTITGEGQATVFIAVDHCSAECVGIHAHPQATRFQALEPIRQGVRQRFGGFGKASARGLAVRHDHGSQYMSHHFQTEIACRGTERSPAFVRAPEGNGCAERFIRTVKENLLWVRSFDTIEELRQALLEFRQTYNATWLIERHGFLTPAQFRQKQLQTAAIAA